MPDPQVTASGERFARDMRRIREAHGVSMEDIHRNTMISVHIIESFEQDGLFEHPTFNRVYLRSFVRSYASAVGVDPERAVEELERALDGDYVNALAVEYLDDEPEAQAQAEEDVEEEPDEAAEEAESPAPQTVPTPTPRRPSSTASAASEPDDEGAPEGSQLGVWIGLGVVVVIIIVWMLVGGLQGTGNDPAPSESASPVAADTVADTTADDTAAADTAQAADTVQAEPLPDATPEADARPAVSLGDTMYFTVVAQEPISPILIRRDDDLRRPYYIDVGQAALFPAQDQIILEEALEDIQLLVNGLEYPVSPHIANGQLVITRDTVEAFLDTVRADLVDIAPADTHHVAPDLGDVSED